MLAREIWPNRWSRADDPEVACPPCEGRGHWGRETAAGNCRSGTQAAQPAGGAAARGIKPMLALDSFRTPWGYCKQSTQSLTPAAGRLGELRGPDTLLGRRPVTGYFAPSQSTVAGRGAKANTVDISTRGRKLDTPTGCWQVGVWVGALKQNAGRSLLLLLCLT